MVYNEIPQEAITGDVVPRTEFGQYTRDNFIDHEQRVTGIESAEVPGARMVKDAGGFQRIDGNNRITFNRVSYVRSDVTADNANDTITVHSNGLYFVSVGIRWIGVNPPNNSLWVDGPNGIYCQSTATYSDDCCSNIVPLNAGDTLYAMAFAGSGGFDVGYEYNRVCYFSVFRIGNI